MVIEGHAVFFIVGRTMTPELIASITGFLVLLGGGFKYILVMSDKKLSALQEKLEAQYAERFASMETKIREQDTEIKRNRTELMRYIRRVGILEGLLQSHGADIPPLEDI